MTLGGIAVWVAVSAAAPSHPVEFWRDIAKHEYQPPPGSDVDALASELSGLLGSPDPELRDEIAYSTLATWIYRKRIIEPARLRRLTDQWLANLKDRVGETGTDDVLRRSFSALMLSVVVARDNAEAFLTAEEFGRIETAALTYFEAERDLRGYDPVKGWMHSAAHTADLLKFLARSRHLDAGGQSRVLDALAQKCVRAGLVFTHGEDERFARVILSIVNREDFDSAAFQAWTLRVRPARPAGRPAPADLDSAQNRKNLLAKTEVLLSLDAQPSAHVQTARESVRVALKDLF